ncbi:MAG: hypothetical protein IJP31_01465 [Lachnospiraceae bacterium]|nr:hypothetical protein [Lachnospiraceae bacterium]
MKKLLATFLSLGLTVSLLGGCGNTVIVQQSSPETQEAATATEQAAESGEEASVTDTEELAEGAVKTGMSIVTTLEGTDAGEEADGSSTTNIGIVAVTVDGQGVIQDCAIDGIKATINFSKEGKLVDVRESFPSKNELGEEYGMKAASSIGKEWNEQAEALAQYAVGKTVEELKNGAVDESGKAKDADLASSATMYIGSFVDQIEAAVNNAADLGASVGDELVITQITHASKSKDAGEEEGLTQAYATIAAMTLKEGTITSMILDGVQANVNFDTAGKITSDLTAEVLSKNELGESYGMKAASSIGKEWNEQAAAFAAYVTGKTIEEVTTIAVTEEGKAGDADLAASVTVSIGSFIQLVEKAGQ